MAEPCTSFFDLSIPSKCRHSDILKNIKVNCSDLTFSRLFSHERAHQEDSKEWEWEELESESQRNCGCDYAAKEELVEIDPEDIPVQKQFPLEPATLFMNGHKITTESGPDGDTVRCSKARSKVCLPRTTNEECFWETLLTRWPGRMYTLPSSQFQRCSKSLHPSECLMFLQPSIISRREENVIVIYVLHAA